MSLRKFLFSESYGRNIIWLMLSGFFTKVDAKENHLGEIIMPDDHYLFNLDNNNLDESYLNYNNLHFIILDGPVQHMNDQRLKKLRKKTQIYYVGKFDNYWQNIENASLLYSDNPSDHEKVLLNIRKKFPIFFKKYFLKKLLTTFSGIKNIKLLSNHFQFKDKHVYYGYIKPTKKHLDNFRKKFYFEDKYIKNFFQDSHTSYDVKTKIKELCVLKEEIKYRINEIDYPYLNELLLFLIRNIICNFLKNKKNFLIYDGKGGKYNFNAYEMLSGNNHIYLDLGSKVGYDYFYPRSALLKFNKKKSIRFYCEEKFFNFNKSDSNLYMQQITDSFFKKLNI